MKRPEDLTREQLEEIVSEVQRALWFDTETSDFDPDHDIESGADFISDIERALLATEPALRPKFLGDR